MRKIYPIIVITSVFCLFTGCKEQQKKSSDAIRTSEQQVSNQPEVAFSAVAQYVRDDGSRYITHQDIEVSANPPAIVITASEPFGTVRWAVQNNIYKAAKNKSNFNFDKELYSIMTNEDIIRGLMDLYCAGLNGIELKDLNETFDFNGQMYDLVAKNAQNVKVYRNQKTKMPDLVIAGSTGQYLLYGYNYQKISKTDESEKFYPAKTDIYLYKSVNDKKLLITISCVLK